MQWTKQVTGIKIKMQWTKQATGMKIKMQWSSEQNKWLI